MLRLKESDLAQLKHCRISGASMRVEKARFQDSKKNPIAKRGGAAKIEWENEELARVVEAFRLRHSDVGDLLIHIPNGGYRKNAFEGWRLKRQGVKAGVSDLFLPCPRNGRHGLWIEFKASPPHDAAVTAQQKDWLKRMEAQGYMAHICRGFDEALAVLDLYLA